MQPIRALFAFDPSIDADRFADHCTQWGIDTPILHSGFFKSDEMARALDRAGLALWLNIPVFHNQGYLETHPDAYAVSSRGRKGQKDWLHFVCPSQDAYLDELVRDIRELLPRLCPTIVSLDFIRHFVFWEDVDLSGPSNLIEDGCYCATCVSRFERSAGERVDRSDAARLLRGPLRSQWARWKCDRIAEVAERLLVEIGYLADEARLAIKTVPWHESDLDGAIRWSVGQDIPRLTRRTDLVTPMAFTHILGQDPKWKRDVLDDARRSTGKPVLSYVQVEKVYRDEDISLTQLENELTEACSSDHAGLAVFHYDQLAADPVKAEVLRKHLKQL